MHCKVGFLGSLLLSAADCFSVLFLLLVVVFFTLDRILSDWVAIERQRSIVSWGQPDGVCLAPYSARLWQKGRQEQVQTWLHFTFSESRK